MGYWMGRSEFGTGPFARIDLNAMAASVTAHAVVAALLVFTWGETVLVEGGTRSTLVSIDLSTREGGPGPKAPSPAEAERPQERAVTPPDEVPSQAVVTEPRPAVQPLPAPAAPAGGGGQGRTGDGTAATTTRQLPVAKLIPVATLVTPISAPGPQTRAAEGVAEARGRGGSGGGSTDQAGNSAVSNFKGRIYQHLQRHRRGNTIGAGAALIGFTIEPDGSARTIQVARTSGSSRFDHEAMALVRRASPFPRPPDGTAHSFTFEITGQ
ncbi:energy transducer TonB family protein [Novosphingobium guangzhouense]|uniref:TonB C-terminal domain-containing protein n=1 Tax=Novosphingobium guangzhouense TaxID=1850347 RepID=A0A2K2G6J1_9SPHN|nr:energy transducer TonB [Novosphingobium guangzhouense]PNU06655.1 hypothetical protein A8V01_00185 [Novosphingobium guangzhouense]